MILHRRKSGHLAWSSIDPKRLGCGSVTPAWATQDYGPTLRMHGGWVTYPCEHIAINGIPHKVSHSFQNDCTDRKELCFLSLETRVQCVQHIFLQEFQDPVADVVCWPFFFLFGRQYPLFFYYETKIPSDEWTPRDVSFSLFGKEYSVHIPTLRWTIELGTIHGDGTGHIFIDGADMGFFPYYVRPSWLKAK